MMPLYEVAILERPKKKDAANGELETLVLGPVTTVAIDEQAAAISAVMDATDLQVDRTRMEVLVRPFA